MRHEEEERGHCCEGTKPPHVRRRSEKLAHSLTRLALPPKYTRARTDSLSCVTGWACASWGAPPRTACPCCGECASTRGERRRSVLKGGAMRPEARRCPVAWRRARRARARIGGQGHEAGRPFSRAPREREERNRRRHRRAGTLAKTSPLPLIPPARLSPSLCFPLPQHHGRPAHPARAHGDDPAQG